MFHATPNEIDESSAPPAGEIVVPPSIDYLVLGTCFQGAERRAVLESLKHATYQHHRFELSGGSIFCDGLQVGRVMGSNAPTTRYGDKVVWHFSGEWFRKDGAGLSPGDAMQLLQALGARLIEDKILVDHWNFVSIDRLDYVTEVKVAPGVTPDDWLSVGLTNDWKWQQGEWSIDELGNVGRTVYGAKCTVPKAKRSQYSHLCVYQNPGEDTVRCEVRIPRVRAVDGSGSIEGAAELAAKMLLEATGHKIQSAGELRQHEGWHTVPVLDFEGRLLPEEWSRKPAKTHPEKTMKRLGKQARTLFRRVSGMNTRAAMQHQLGIVATAATIGATSFTVDVQAADPPTAEQLQITQQTLAPGVVSAPVFEEEMLDEIEQDLARYRDMFYGSKTIAERRYSHVVQRVLSYYLDDELCQEINHKIRHGMRTAPPLELAALDDVWLDRYIGRVDHEVLPSQLYCVVTDFGEVQWYTSEEHYRNGDPPHLM